VNVTPCSPVHQYLRFELICCSVDIGNMLLRIVGTYFPTTSHGVTYQKTKLRKSLPWDIQISHKKKYRPIICVPCGLRRMSITAWLVGSRVRIPLRAWMFVSCVCFVSCR